MDSIEKVDAVGMLFAISEKVREKSISRLEDFTGADGLKYCGICGKAKEAYLPDISRMVAMRTGDKIPLTNIIVNALCDCDMKRDEKIEKNRKLQELQSRCFPLNILPVMIQKTFANDNHRGDPKPMQKAKIYADKFSEMLKENVSLIFYGNPGSGKSYATACIANSVMEQGYSCLMTSFPEIIRKMFKAEDKDKYIQSLCECDLLIIDDMFKEHRTEYALSIVWQVIDARCTLGLPMVLSTNTEKSKLREYSNKEEFIDATLDSIKSRLREAWLIAYYGADRRQQNAIDKQKKLKEILQFDD